MKSNTIEAYQLSSRVQNKLWRKVSGQISNEVFNKASKEIFYLILYPTQNLQTPILQELKKLKKAMR